MKTFRRYNRSGAALVLLGQTSQVCPHLSQGKAPPTCISHTSLDLLYSCITELYRRPDMATGVDTGSFKLDSPALCIT